jgi:hypothetical protein
MFGENLRPDLEKLRYRLAKTSDDRPRHPARLAEELDENEPSL